LHCKKNCTKNISYSTQSTFCKLAVRRVEQLQHCASIIPKIKMSENVVKITNPGYKKVFRLFDRKNNKAIADVIVNAGEVIDDSKPYEIFDPDHTWKRKTVTDFYAKELQVQIFDKGKCVYKVPEINEIRDYCREQINTLWDEVLRFENPHKYYVDLSEELWNIKNKLLKEHTLL